LVDNACHQPEPGVTHLDLPVYFLQAAYDYTCSYSEARAYFEMIEAPVKGFYTFSNSAHIPVFEEPARAAEILSQDVLTGKAGLADP
jgi:pimeloyl-ACP methyl ester carboxylesterase